MLKYVHDVSLDTLRQLKIAYKVSNFCETLPGNVQSTYEPSIQKINNQMNGPILLTALCVFLFSGRQKLWLD